MRTLVTLRQVASAAGCGVATASAALRGLPGVALETRARVQAAAIQLGYRQSKMVSGLMAEKRQGAPDNANRKPTLRQIAASAGCSLATVSLALRDAPRIPEPTRKRIQAIAQSLGYQADPREAAVHHRRRARPSISSSTTLAFINFFRSVRFWRSEAAYQGFFLGAERRAAEMGCKLEAFHPKAQGISGARLTKMLRARGIEGVILGSSPRASAHATLDWPQFTIVAQGLSLLRPQVSRVAGDYAYNIRLTMHHLRRLGYKRIGFHLGAAEDLRCDQLWSGGFLAYQLRMPQEECIPLQIDQKTDVEAGRPALREWIRTWRPDVIITAGSYIVEWLRSAGYDVPGDIAVASMSLSRNSPLEHPALQGMGGLDQGFGRQGGVALDMLLSQMVTNQKGLPTERKRIFIQGEWIDGWSLPRKGPAAGPLQAWRTLICADAAEAPHSAAKWKPQA